MTKILIFQPTYQLQCLFGVFYAVNKPFLLWGQPIKLK